jgi:hypothetical protein
MVKVKFEEQILPREFISARSANICINKLIRKYIRENVPATKTKKQQKSLTKEYVAGIRNKFSLVEEPVRLKKALFNEKVL